VSGPGGPLWFLGRIGPYIAPSGWGAAQNLVLITCRDEKHQVELLGRFHGEGLECKALLS
jgi:hypothetical protein